MAFVFGMLIYPHVYANMLNSCKMLEGKYSIIFHVHLVTAEIQMDYNMTMTGVVLDWATPTKFHTPLYKICPRHSTQVVLIN